jgi:hypothetical protein
MEEFTHPAAATPYVTENLDATLDAEESRVTKTA